MKKCTLLQKQGKLAQEMLSFKPEARGSSYTWKNLECFPGADQRKCQLRHLIWFDFISFHFIWLFFFPSSSCPAGSQASLLQSEWLLKNFLCQSFASWFRDSAKEEKADWAGVCVLPNADWITPISLLLTKGEHCALSSQRELLAAELMGGWFPILVNLSDDWTSLCSVTERERGRGACKPFT